MNTPPQSTVTGLRVYLAVSTLVHPALWFLREAYRPGDWDPFLGRLALGLFCAAVLVGSYRSASIRQHLSLWSTLTVFAAQVFYLVVARAQGLDVQSTIAIVIVTAVGMATSRELHHAIAFAGASVVAIGLAYWGLPEPAIHHIPFQVLNLTAAAAVGVAVQSRVALERSLESRVAERTAELEAEVARHRRTEAELIANQEDLERTHRELYQARRLESLGRLAGGVAHDFNNLLTVILGRIDPLTTHADPEVVRKSTIARGAAERAAGLTAQLLGLGHVSSRGAAVLDLSSVVEQLHDLLRRAIREDIELDVHAAANPRVRIERSRLEQVVMNLCLNGQDACVGGGRITVRIDVEQERGGDWGVLTVEDDGEGMGPDVVERMFDPYFSTKPTGSGTGLGLSTVHSAVSDAGGTIEVQSQLGRGTTFRVRLPLVAIAEPQPAQPRAIDADGDDLDGVRVLLIDDDADVREVLLMMLRALGAEVRVTGSPQQAITWAAATPFDVLVTDVVMPESSGPSMAATIRATSPMPVLYVSGHLHTVLDHEPMAIVLRKPFDQHALLRAVLEVMASGQPAK